MIRGWDALPEMRLEKGRLVLPSGILVEDYYLGEGYRVLKGKVSIIYTNGRHQDIATLGFSHTLNLSNYLAMRQISEYSPRRQVALDYIEHHRVFKKRVKSLKETFN